MYLPALWQLPPVRQTDRHWLTGTVSHDPSSIQDLTKDSTDELQCSSSTLKQLGTCP